MSDNRYDLQPWLDTARTALDTALDAVLDLEAGLADARLPGRHALLTHRLDAVLDLNAGLDQILPTRRSNPPPDPAPRPDRPAGLSAFSAFVDTFGRVPILERFTARTWLPQEELAQLRTLALGGTFGVDLALDLALARALDRALDSARVFAFDLDRNRDPNCNRALDLALALDRARDHARALAFDLARDHLRARDLEIELDRARDRARERALASARALERELDLARDRALALDRARDCALDFTRARALERALDFTRALAQDLARALDLAPAFLRELVTAVAHLETMTTNMTNADLSHLDLSGIPLDGVRWSHRTRWPVAWQDEIQRNSIELEPGLYEIRSGGVDINRAVNTPL